MGTMMEHEFKLSGRVLYLSCSLDAVRRQLAGENLTLEECLPLRDDVSTDEISPTNICIFYDDRLAHYAHIGFKVEGEKPIAIDALRDGRFEVIVAGKRYGKGSSRETSPISELYAGVRLVVAENFERIYRQNCDNIGLLTTTDFSILDKITAGESVSIDEFLVGRDAMTQDVVRAGGLLRYSQSHLPRIRGKHVSDVEAGRPLSLVEKIIARRKLVPATEVAPGEGMFINTDWRFSHDAFTGMCAHIIETTFGPDMPLERPEEVVAFQDHFLLAEESFPQIRDKTIPVVKELHAAHWAFAKKYGAHAYGQLPDERGGDGICHPIMTEKHALPGQVIVGTDSHTPHSGALGCLAFGAGATDIANSYVTGLIRFRMPEVIRIELTGRLRPGVLARDVVQFLLQTEPVRQGKTIAAVFEYGGPAVKAMGMDDRATLTNLVAELGGLTGIIEPDE
ncbi:MAG: aconitase family protein, partial [Burkholderiales bacterium]